jgi:hypothetical protein
MRLTSVAVYLRARGPSASARSPVPGLSFFSDKREGDGGRRRVGENGRDSKFVPKFKKCAPASASRVEQGLLVVRSISIEPRP